MNNNALSILNRIGLKDKDAKVYLACLRFRGGLYVKDIVKETSLVRSTVDVIIDRLIEKGFLNKVKVENRFKYIAQRPEAVLFRQEELLRDFKEIVPDLSLLGGENANSEIRFFEGEDGFREIHRDILMKLKFSKGKGRQLLSFTSGLDVLNIFPDLQKRFIEKRVEMGVQYRCIVPMSSTSVYEYQSAPEVMREIKSIEEEKFPFKVTLEIYSDSVMIFSPRKPYGGAVITNPEISSSMRALFELVWSLLPDS